MKNTQNKKIGVLLVNLGTPDSPRPFDVFRYLNEFLTDERVIDLPWLRRQLLVRGVIVPFRFLQSAAQYRLLWTEKGSPLLYHGISVKEKLKQALGDEFQVALAMRYRVPSIREGLEELQKFNPDRIVVFPLFPQYASATTGSVHAEAMKCLSEWLIVPELTFVSSFYDHPKLIEAFCARIREHTSDSYDHLLFSFHGLPERHILRADRNGTCLRNNCCDTFCSRNRFCYKAQCHATARAIADRLGIDSEKMTICFQSRLGKDPWLKPYTVDAIHRCIQKGNRRVLVVSPSFVCDCLETIFEIDCEYKKLFLESGGEEFHSVVGLNDHPIWIDALRSMIEEHLSR